MKYLLDTNICIHFFRGKFNLFDKIESAGLSKCAISEIKLAELVFGAENSSNPQKNYEIIEQFIGQITVLPIFDSIYKYAKEKARLFTNGLSDYCIIMDRILRTA